jgi:hypothetical protein
MIQRVFSEIDGAEIKRLIDDSVSESRTTEFKRQLPGSKDEDKREFLSDVSSFANADGGDIVYGIIEKEGAAESVCGIDANIDSEMLRLEGILRSGIEPRMKYYLSAIDVDETRVLLLRVLKSWNKPHRVVYRGHDKFYSRNSAGKYPMDVEELRGAFVGSYEVESRIKAFTTSRIDDIRNNLGQVSLPDCGKLVFMVIPFDSFGTSHKLEIASLSSCEIQPICAGGWSGLINLDGYLVYTATGDGNDISYVQIYRNGIIEFVCASMFDDHEDGKPFIPSTYYEIEVIKAFRSSLEAYQTLEIEFPLALAVSFTNIRGYRFAVDQRILRSTMKDRLYKKELLSTPIEILTDAADSAPKMLKPVFDTVWNAFGYPGSRNYGTDGEWKKA